MGYPYRYVCLCALLGPYQQPLGPNPIGSLQPDRRGRPSRFRFGPGGLGFRFFFELLFMSALGLGFRVC